MECTLQNKLTKLIKIIHMFKFFYVFKRNTFDVTYLPVS